ncbi:MAG TPA: M55 family metallopeptidase [Candidatus Baltobacteraceae bacterium]|jgi:D-amino peptidase|nr:M55 family metallopeptidase [Candidatus Baltobacteraceae bacterium]
MKLFISADMEGTAGVASWAQVDPANAHEYPVYRRYMMREVRAAIDGARSSGAEHVLIRDSHWNQSNVLWDELPEDVRAIVGSPTPLSMNDGVDATFAGAFFTGYHGAAGTENSTLAHTYNPDTLHSVAINGTRCSEALLNAAVLGYYGVPLLMITGDRTIVEEVMHVMPWVRGIIVKESIGYYAVNSLTPQAACDRIREGARDAFARRESAKPFTFAPPIELTIETANVGNADFIELLPGFERTGGRALRFACTDYLVAFRAFLVATRLGSAANAPA